MKKENIYKFLYVVSALLILGFAIHTIVDACRYDSVLTSFPFYAFVISNAVIYLVPGVIVFVVGCIMKRKYANKADKEK